MKKKTKSPGKNIAKKALACILAASCIMTAAPMGQVRAFKFNYKSNTPKRTEPLGKEGCDSKALETETSEIEASEIEPSETETSETETSKRETSERETSERETSETATSETATSETEASETELSESETSESETPESPTTEDETETSTEALEEETEIETESETETETEVSDRILPEDLMIKKDEGSFGTFDGKYCFIVNLELRLKDGSKFEECMTKPMLRYTIEETKDTPVLIRADAFRFHKDNQYCATLSFGFDHAGDYSIVFMDESGYRIGEVNYSIPLGTQSLSLKKQAIRMKYGEIIYIDELIQPNKDTEDNAQENKLRYPDNYEATVREDGVGTVAFNLYEHLYKDKDEKDNDGREERDFIEAVGVNGVTAGKAVISIQLKATPFKAASNAEELTIIIDPIETKMTVNMRETVKMYQQLPLEVALSIGNADCTEELLGEEGKASIDFYIYPSETESNLDENLDELESHSDAVKVNSSQLACRKCENGVYQYAIPVTKEYFGAFKAGETYTIHASFAYDKELLPNLYAPYHCNAVDREVTLSARKAELDLSIDDETLLDYRTFFNGEKKPNLIINLRDITESTESIEPASSTESAESIETTESIESTDSNQEIVPEEKKNITYQILSYDTDVVKIGDEAGEAYSPDKNVAPLTVAGVGSTTVRVRALGSSAYTIPSRTVDIQVPNATLYDGDFLIKLAPKSGAKPLVFESGGDGEGFEKWKTYLREHNYWINGTVEIALSDTGVRYFDHIATEDAQNGEQDYKNYGNKIMLDSSFQKQPFLFWAEHSQRNVSTKAQKNGTRAFTIGIDLDAPSLEAFAPGKNYFQPTKTDTEQYYAQDFVLTGSFRDDISGVSKIEYTTNYKAAEGDRNWKDAVITERKQETAFRIALPDGEYPAIAVRAYDHAGNVSPVKPLTNEKGEFIRIIVDSAAPTLHVNVSSDGKPYTGEGENWTNQSIDFSIAYHDGSSPYAGLYRCEYAYEKIGEAARNKNNANHKISGWKTISTDKAGTAEFSIGSSQSESKNGYYYFRAVSKSGIQSEALIKERVLLQQGIPAKKEVVEIGGNGSRKNEWYNKDSGVLQISFAYPDYDDGAKSGEYGAPVTLHYNLQVENENATVTMLAQDATATIGVAQSSSYKNGKFETVSDDLDKQKIDFGAGNADGMAKDGVYTLEYWISDMAGNVSEKETRVYKIDCHAPTDLSVKVDGQQMAVDSEAVIRYQSFYQKDVGCSAAAQYGISGKDSIKILKAKKIGDWNGAGGLENGDHFEIADGNRCFIYVVAEDVAGNKTEGWTRGVVVDRQAPEGKSADGLILEPEGANEHGFFNQDIEVRIAVKDAPDQDNCAALKSVAGVVGQDGGSTAVSLGLFEFLTDLPTDEEITAASTFETTQLIDAAANEGNHAYIEVTAADRSDNVFSSTQVLKIDVTKPEIEISLDNQDAENASYYNAGRTATIHVKELNFNPEAVEVNVTRNGEKIAKQPLSDWTSDGIDHYANLAFQEDGAYTLSVKCTDLADNESEEVSVDAFTIDKTLPELRVELAGSGTGAMREGYFHSAVTANITVTERNFREEDFILNASSHAKIGAWIHQDDVHTAQITFNEDNCYSLGFAYTDLAGNSIKEFTPMEFTIDTAPPAVTISGVADGSANSGEITPVITVSDLNIEQRGTTIEVTTGRGRSVQTLKETAAGESGTDFTYTLSDMSAKEDDIYYLTVTATDLAGNESRQRIRFSLNRKGSTYDISGLSDMMEQYYHTYKEIGDIQVVEMNVDNVEDFQLYLSRNGRMITDGIQYRVETNGSEDLGYTFTYTIDKKNFEKEGTYRLGFYSKDRAGNEVNNTLDANGGDIQFVVDDTPPKVVIEGVETGKVYDVPSRNVHVMVFDNFKLDQAAFRLVDGDGKELDRWDYCGLVDEMGETAAITIPEYDTELSLLFHAKDAAGNEITTVQGSKSAPTGFMITTNKWAKLIHKPEKMQAAAKRIAETFAVPEEFAFMAIAMTTAALIILAAVGAGMLVASARKRRAAS